MVGGVVARSSLSSARLYSPALGFSYILSTTANNQSISCSLCSNHICRVPLPDKCVVRCYFLLSAQPKRQFAPLGIFNFHRIQCKCLMQHIDIYDHPNTSAMFWKFHLSKPSDTSAPTISTTSRTAAPDMNLGLKILYSIRCLRR